MVISVLLIHAVMLPVLSFGILTLVRNVQEDVFIDHVRIYARVFADLLQAKDSLALEAEILASLDSSILGGRCVYAAITIGETRMLSSLMRDEDADAYVEDFEFGQHGDDTYFLSMPLQVDDNDAVLQLGFDEKPALLAIESARNTIFAIMLVYLLVTVILVVILSSLVARPLRRLKQDSHKIASGDYARKMTVDSDILELRELAEDLEHMRSALVGVNARLAGEISSREAAEAERRKAEIHLRHMHRLQSIGTLAGGVAHEFNNVLLPLLLYTELALEDLPAGSPVQSNLERVLKLANRAKGLSEQILTFGRPSGEVMSVVADIAPVIDEAMSMVRALIPATIDIQIDIKRPAGPISCNENEIQQLVVNLCSNAFQALHKGGDVISVSVANCQVDSSLAEQNTALDEGPYVCLSVKDTGEGMDTATIEQMFDPFFTTREVGEGTGLGLSVVHGIVAKHGGAIIVTSKLQSGTKVDVYFRRESEQASQNDKGTQNE